MADSGQWEVVGGKSKTKSASIGKKKESSGKGTSNGGAPIPTLKVEELGNNGAFSNCLKSMTNILSESYST